MHNFNFLMVKCESGEKVYRLPLVSPTLSFSLKSIAYIREVLWDNILMNIYMYTW